MSFGGLLMFKNIKFGNITLIAVVVFTVTFTSCKKEYQGVEMNEKIVCLLDLLSY